MSELSLQDKKLATWLKWILGLLAAVVVSPIIFMAVKGLVGIAIALVIAWGVGLFVTQIMPALSSIIGNYALKLIKWDASTNPIETLQLQYVKRSEQLEDMKGHIADFDTNVRTFASKLKGLKEQFPTDAGEFDQQLGQLQALLTQQRNQAAHVAAKLELFQSEIVKARAKWDVAIAAQGAFKSAGKASANAMDTIKRETALDAVELELNRAFAELNTAINQDLPSVSQVQSDAAAMRRVGVVQP